MIKPVHAIALALLAASCAPDDAGPADDSGSTGQSDGSAPGPADRSTGDPPAQPSGRVSKYTSFERCRVVVSRPDEGGYSSSDCPGVGGYALRLIDADARQNLFVRAPDGTETSLALSEAAGSGFSRVGERIEWRGADGQSGFQPDSMVVRYFVVEAEGEPEVAYLLPVMLGDGGPCVAARIPPGAEQSDRAREVADGEMRCLGS